MITIITLVSSRDGFETLKRNLINFEPDWNLGVDLLCLVSDKKLYLECRDFLLDNANRGECRVVLGDSLKHGREEIEGKNPYIFILGEGILIPFGGLTRLYNTMSDKPQAGFVSGVFKQYPVVYWVKDIYGSPKYVYSNEKTNYDLRMSVDVAPVHGLLTKTNLYKELFCMSDLDGYGGYSFGIRLRRQGYKNYVDTGVEYKHRRNNENYHVEGSAR